MKYIFFILVLTPALLQAQSIKENEAKIKDYEGVIAMYQHKIDSIQDVISKAVQKENQKKYRDGIIVQADQKTVLYRTTNYNEGKILDIQIGDTILVVKQVETKYLAVSHGRTGYVITFALIGAMTPEQKLLLEDNWRKEISRERAIAAQKEAIAAQKKDKRKADIQAKRKSDLIKLYGTTTGLKIYGGEIWLGMTDKMARDSWGSPDDINRSVGSYGVHEQWVYGKYDTYVYFENGVLTSWQD